MAPPQWIIILFVFLFLISYSSAAPSSGIVGNISATEAENLPGMTHITLAGALLHGFKEVEVWVETAAPGVHTPIHRHDCEEVIVVLKGSGTLYLGSHVDDDDDGGGGTRPQEIPFHENSTVRIPPNHAHQAWNTNPHQDLHVIVIISRPPLRLWVYSDWSAPHESAKEMFPTVWDNKFLLKANANPKDDVLHHHRRHEL
ncbi:auxin-binding protein T85-like [Andrographis paniculata]|uniref:auxin-binding protein T85-like n=1 Tax=Andrographis paniculata TaxID=175694 RepID=UPI0021E81472|nr:auxin-binding protein T85-like [Andrographis paniculata]